MPKPECVLHSVVKVLLWALTPGGGGGCFIIKNSVLPSGGGGGGPSSGGEFPERGVEFVVFSASSLSSIPMRVRLGRVEWTSVLGWVFSLCGRKLLGVFRRVWLW